MEYVYVFDKGEWKLEGDEKTSGITAEEFKKYSDRFWDIKNETQRNDHPAPFPEDLDYRLIEFCTYCRNVVLDPFGARGTVALVA